MIDDSADNLHQAKELGMKTIWFGSKAHPLPFTDAVAKDMQALAECAEKLSALV
jgi:pyrimidine 5'-nucleotidase